MNQAWLILNGKKASSPNIRQAVYRLREMGYSIQVRATWENGDIARFFDEACNLNVERIIVGGGVFSDGHPSRDTRITTGYFRNGAKYK